MLFNFGNFSITLLIFFAQGIIFSFLLLKKGVEHQVPSSKWLSLFIFLCALYITPFMLGYANWYSQQPYRDILFYTPLQQVFLIGPVLFFYTQSLLNKAFRISKKDLLHFLPAGLYLLYSLVVFISDKVILGDYYFYADGRDKDLAPWYQITGLISMLIYLMLSLRYYYQYQKLVYQVVSFAESLLFKWIRSYLLAFLFILFLRVLSLLVFPEWGNFGDRFWYYVFFSILFLYIALNGYTTSLQAVIPFHASFFEKEAVYLFKEKKETPNPIERSEGQRKDRKEIPNLEQWKQRLSTLMKEQSLYKNPKLTLADVAEQLETNPKLTSSILSQGFQMNFNDFINQHRVEAVIEQLKAGEHIQKTLLSIALDCGFNSKATFNRAFKKHTSMPPKKYIIEIDR